jgi:hypothetical protein
MCRLHCRYTEPDLDNVVEGVRAYDGKSYGDLVAEWKQCLASPDIDDTDSAARRRLEDLALSLRDVYCTKVTVDSKYYMCYACPSVTRQHWQNRSCIQSRSCVQHMQRVQLHAIWQVHAEASCWVLHACVQLRLSTRMLQEVRVINVEALGKLMNQLEQVRS